jgi:2-amino-4-hydroxy-6-hydroxymethyldihydropteridine diphosphokinase
MPDERSVDLSARLGHLSLGSNIGEREVNVLRALRFIADLDGVRVNRCSSLYETAPVDGVAGGDFINAVLEVMALLQPMDLLLRLKALEKQLGRSQGHLAAREIDIDIISLGDLSIRQPSLSIPHPRYDGRAFVLVPLREIAPDFRCPLTNRHIDDMIERLPSHQRVSPVSARGGIHV